MKDPKSNRNRHTGRINAAKQFVIDNGELFVADCGRRYASAMTGNFVKDVDGVLHRRGGRTLVRLPA